MTRCLLLLPGLLLACTPQWDVGDEIEDDSGETDGDDGDRLDEWSIGDQPEPEDAFFDEIMPLDEDVLIAPATA